MARGGIVGVPNEPSRLAAGGVWYISNIFRDIKNNKWPDATIIGEFIGAVANNNGGSTNADSLIVDVPTGTQPGDVLIAFQAEGDGRTQELNVDFTTISTADDSNHGHVLAYRVVEDGDANSYTFSIASSAGFIASLTTIRGVIAANNELSPAAGLRSGQGGSEVIDEFVASKNDIIMHFIGGRNTTTTLPSSANTVISTTNGNGTLVVGFEQVEASGNTGNFTFTDVTTTGDPFYGSLRLPV